MSPKQVLRVNEVLRLLHEGDGYHLPVHPQQHAVFQATTGTEALHQIGQRCHLAAAVQITENAGRDDGRIKRRRPGRCKRPVIFLPRLRRDLEPHLQPGRAACLGHAGQLLHHWRRVADQVDLALGGGQGLDTACHRGMAWRCDRSGLTLPGVSTAQAAPW